MTRSSFLFLLFMLSTPLSIYAQAQDNPELTKMYHEDQSARQGSNINWKILSASDSLRQVRVYQLIDSGRVVTGMDHYNSAMIFQHGRDSIASSMAVKQMQKAIALDPTINKWLLAAAIDRDLMRRNKPQIYGTQYTKMNGETKWTRYKLDSTQVTDEERKKFGVETLAEQRIKEHNMNLLSLSDFYAQAKSIDIMIDLIKSEHKKEQQATYNVTEGGVNNFGNQLIHENKLDDALKIFTLNTKLYPKGYNTFDKLGECLLLLNRKKEGIKTYRKSLELNPKNEHARKIIDEVK
jgi:tetratricopeptide (TPR) repeat protein